jgi:hypothetical protein
VDLPAPLPGPGSPRSALGGPGRARSFPRSTWAYIFLIEERIARTDGDCSWDEFAHNHPDLLNWSEGILRRYYRDETLRLDLAREIFVMPDRWISIPDEGDVSS